MTAPDWDAAPRVEEAGKVDRRAFDSVLQPRGRPFVARGLVSDWPIVAAGANGAAAALAYADRLAGPATIETFESGPEIGGRFFYNAAMDGFNFSRSRTNFAALSARLTALAAASEPPAIYAGAIPLSAVFPSLAMETPCPLLDVRHEMLSSLWVGNRTRVAAHWDLPQNLICNVAGRRRYILLPPDELSNLYVGPLDFTLAGQPLSLVDFLAPDYDAHPRFRAAACRAEVAVLGPGDVLYLPSMWWHHAESLDPIGVMINFWWRDGPAYLTTPMSTLAHALLTIRDLPPGEKEVWRTMFDCYIFGEGDGPLAHLAPDRRGVFGPSTPERRAVIRALVSRSLSGVG